LSKGSCETKIQSGIIEVFSSIQLCGMPSKKLRSSRKCQQCRASPQPYFLGSNHWRKEGTQLVFYKIVVAGYENTV
jgi:hypothetical protein